MIKSLSDKAKMPTHARLYYGCPDTDSDLLYFGRFRAPDPFAALDIGGAKIALLSPLEIGRARRGSGFDELVDLLSLRSPEEGNETADLIARFCRSRAVGEIEVPPTFPVGLYEALKARGLGVSIGDTPFEPGRLHKTPAEQDGIRSVNERVAGAFAKIEALLRRAEPNPDGTLRLDGSLLTSEGIRRLIDMHCLENGLAARDTIVAGGEQACDPHETGSGPLRAGELIIVDIFPRDNRTGLHGDMTRTYLVGQPSEALRRLVEAVLRAQRAAFARIAPGVSAPEVHQAVVDSFKADGYKTGTDANGHYGFFHGTGHGLGLDVHEEPRVSRTGGELEEGMVFTVEPGLYYPGTGGCRIEDVVVVTAKGFRFLSDHPRATFLND